MLEHWQEVIAMVQTGERMPTEPSDEATAPPRPAEAHSGEGGVESPEVPVTAAVAADPFSM